MQSEGKQLSILPDISEARRLAREKYDFYPTPERATMAILNRLDGRLPFPYGKERNVHWLEPFVGDGDIIKAANRHTAFKDASFMPTCSDRIIWHGYDIDDSHLAELQALNIQHLHCPEDFLAAGKAIEGKPFDVCLTNPPYFSALECIEAAIAVSSITIMFLRVDFLGSQERKDFHRRRPADIFVLPFRPSCTGDGKTDRYNYAWFVWGLTKGGHWEVLDG